MARISQLHTQAVSTQYWTKIYTKHPFCIYFYGPFSTLEQAEQTQESYVNQLELNGKKVVSCFQVQPSIQQTVLDSCSMNHMHWLHDLMQDYLRLQVTHLDKENPTVIEHHSQFDAFISS